MCTAGPGTSGSQMEAASAGAGATIVPADGATKVFSDVTAGGSLVTPMGTSVGVFDYCRTGNWSRT